MNTNDALIHVVDDDASVRHACRYMLETVGLDCRDWPDGRVFLEQADLYAAGVVLLDMRMPHWDGRAVQAHLGRLGSPLSIIILTGHADVPMVTDAFRGGAVDFLEKPVLLETLLPAIERALARSEQACRLRRLQGLYHALSPRERAVIQGVRTGMTNREIADAQGVSVRYVEVQRAQAMEKLGAAHMADLIRILTEIGDA
ncbi:MAG: response regulator [Castellaniella sp.]|uniref:response regulator n=1 Tax=Castellaniella sp. TaxID=1955812 RepID=UPI002A36EF50|nr:response regulator [Castellaniella sp.]MDY0310010.1 response regulator [Castellaniella sp.]